MERLDQIQGIQAIFYEAQRLFKGKIQLMEREAFQYFIVFDCMDLSPQS